MIRVLSTAGDSKQNEISMCEVVEGQLDKSNFANLYIQDLKK